MSEPPAVAGGQIKLRNIPMHRDSGPTTSWVVLDVSNANSARRQRGCLRQRAAERRQNLAPGAGSPRGHPAWGACASRSERNPGITSSLNSSAGFSRRKHRAPKSNTWFIAPLQGAENFSNLFQGWRDLRSLTPGYFLQPLRG